MEVVFSLYIYRENLIKTFQKQWARPYLKTICHNWSLVATLSYDLSKAWPPERRALLSRSIYRACPSSCCKKARQTISRIGKRDLQVYVTYKR